MSNFELLIATSHREPRSLQAIAGDASVSGGETLISGISDDSRALQPGEAFLCLPRAAGSADTYLQQAEERGAAAIIAVGSATYSGDLPCLKLATMEQAGELLRRWFGTEESRVKIIGITGTDGKTSCTWMLREMLERLLGSAWSIGTLGWVRNRSEVIDLGNTTPSLLNMHRILAAAESEGIPTIVAEVSSHGIDQQRIAGLSFTAALWTNIGHDHLQDHGGFEAYAAIKQGFIRSVMARGGIGICNDDDEEIRARIDEGSRYGHSLYREEVALGWEQELPGMLRLKQGEEEIRIEEIPLGDFHAENMAAVSLVLMRAFGVPLARIPGLAAGIAPPPGRLQDISVGHWQAFVDYAHTPEALKRCLESARKLVRNRLLLVFGCGGERDRGKRPQMGLIAAECADAVWITSDNPRNELPEVIASEIESGMPKPYPADVHLQLDRRLAITEAIESMQRGDVLVIAGKGHESYMEIGGKRIDWSDAGIASELLHDKNSRTDLRACA